MRQRADGIADNDPAVIENFLEFRSGFGALVRGQIGLPARINRIEGSKETMYAAAGLSQLIGNRDL